MYIANVVGLLWRFYRKQYTLAIDSHIFTDILISIWGNIITQSKNEKYRSCSELYIKLVQYKSDINI